MKPESKQQILERRKEIEQELVDMLKETKSDFSLQHVKDAIFHAEDNDDMMKMIAMFDRGGDASELSNILELVTDAWNYFPHERLGGVSPVEKSLEYEKKYAKNKNSEKSKDNMPRVRVGDREMSWNEHQVMLAEMEKAQQPFKKWISGVLKDYKSFLKQDKSSTQEAKKHYFIAETFFDRVLWLGWLDFGSIRKEFITDEFPKWWQTHVISSGINDPKEIKASVHKLADFIEKKYLLKGSNGSTR
ncbi:MAG: hypothetical protein WCK03_01490 [Candidatus Taylorbacteria bacterium]